MQETASSELQVSVADWPFSTAWDVDVRDGMNACTGDTDSARARSVRYLYIDK